MREGRRGRRGGEERGKEGEKREAREGKNADRFRTHLQTDKQVRGRVERGERGGKLKMIKEIYTSQKRPCT